MDHQFLVGGEWRSSTSIVDVVSPYTGKPFARVFAAEEKDLDDALQSSLHSFEEIRSLPAYRRSEFLTAVVDGLRNRNEELAKTIALEAGKPIVDGRREVQRSMITFQTAAEEAKRLDGDLIPLDLMAGAEKRVGVLKRFPIGPILGISPFNFPLNLVAHKVAPAMASGNPIVVKPATKTPLSALLLGEIIAASGYPAGGVNIVPCRGSIAERMVSDDRIKKLTFTGSGEIGWKLKGLCGRKRVTLELGGNAAAVVHADADVEFAARRSVTGSFSFAGQTCISIQRIYVHRSLFNDFLNRFVGHAAGLKMGDPLDEATTLGPMIDDESSAKTERWIGEALRSGAKIVAGGKRQGRFFEATILTGTAPAMKVNCEEVFAPVVTVEAYDSFEDAIARVNDSRYGLQTGVFTNDIKRIFYAYDRLDVGGVVINDIPTFRIDSMPYGGVKESGIGREGIRYAIEEMTEPKLLILNVS